MECDDGIDNDGDGQIDLADTDCTDLTDSDEAIYACSDGIDNDGDTLKDLTDPGCVDSTRCF